MQSVAGALGGVRKGEWRDSHQRWAVHEEKTFKRHRRRLISWCRRVGLGPRNSNAVRVFVESPVDPRLCRSTRERTTRMAEGGREMIYILMIYADEGDWTTKTEAEMAPVMSAHTELEQSLRTAGKYKGCGGLAPSASATTVRIQNGKTL